MKELYNSANEDLDTIYFKDGQVVERYSCPLKRNDKIDGRVWSFRDITEQKHAEKALRESEERLKAIFDANPDPIIVYNNQGHPEYLNAAFIEVFGWSLDELRGQRIPFVPDAQKEITHAKIDELFTSGKPVRLDTQRLNKQGDTIDVIISAAAIKGSKGESVGMVVNLTDVTDRKRLETRLQQAPDYYPYVRPWV